MAFPGDVNSLGSVSGSQTLAAAGHATRHNEVKTALEGIRDALGGTAVPSGTVQPILAAGSASAPSLSFTGDSNTGLWSPGADTVAFSTGGVERLRIDSSGQITTGLGSAAAPVLSFSGDTNTGVFSPAADAVGISVGGVSRFQISAQGVIQHNNVANWNFSNVNFFRRSSNTATPRFIAMLLDGDSDADTTIGGYNAIWGTYDSAPTTSSTSSGLNGKMAYGAYAGHRFYVNGTERVAVDTNGLITGTGTSLGAWTAFTPTLTASTTNPTLGTGSTASGYYIQIGKMVVVRIGLQFGTSGAAAGTGTYTIGALPVSAATSGAGTTRQVGPIMLYDASANVVWTGGQAEMSGTTLTNLYYGNGTTLTAVGAAAPWTWAASDQIRLSFVYEAA